MSVVRQYRCDDLIHNLLAIKTEQIITLSIYTQILIFKMHITKFVHVLQLSQHD